MIELNINYFKREIRFNDYKDFFLSFKKLYQIQLLITKSRELNNESIKLAGIFV